MGGGYGGLQAGDEDAEGLAGIVVMLGVIALIGWVDAT